LDPSLTEALSFSAASNGIKTWSSFLISCPFFNFVAGTRARQHFRQTQTHFSQKALKETTLFVPGIADKHLAEPFFNVRNNSSCPAFEIGTQSSLCSESLDVTFFPLASPHNCHPRNSSRVEHFSPLCDSQGTPSATLAANFNCVQWLF
jgi:hypothetical protein